MQTNSQGRGRRESSRLTTCGASGCFRPFAVCGACDRGRRYCSLECAGVARRSSVRRAGKRYQGTERGRSLHAVRQARYRDRQRAVTHQARAVPANYPRISETLPIRSEVRVTPVAECRREICVPPDCAICLRRGTFLRNGFLRRNRARVAHPRRVDVRKAPGVCLSQSGPMRRSEALAAPRITFGITDPAGPHERHGRCRASDEQIGPNRVLHR